MAGVNGLLLTTTGRHSGEPRPVPLLCVPTPDGYVIAASNWVWDLLTERWPAYRTYADRSGRDIRVFVLTPVGN
jgi:F420H(2)-dependent quinone reductase